MSNSQSQKNLQVMINNPAVKDRFADVLGKNPSAFISSVLSIANSNKQLKDCDPVSVINAAGIAATLNLPVNPSLGFAYIVPRKGIAGFQLGYKGWTQLALRSGQYARLYAGVIHEGELDGIDPYTGDPVRGHKISDKVVGYIAYLRLVNGFEHTEYMSVEEIQAHAEKFSVGYQYDLKQNKQTSPWSTNFDSMAKKTVLLKLMRLYGAVSLELQQAVAAETATNAGEPLDDFIDEISAPEKDIDFETGEVIENGVGDSLPEMNFGTIDD